jgi:phenylacetic acid degradation operon negative regulatory protein
VAAGSIFGLEENNVRVALARLLRRGLVERDERGRYRLGRSAEAVRERVAGWRRPRARLRPWKGGWVAVLGAPTRRRGSGLRSERALRWLGMRELSPGLFVRPDNLKGGVAEARSDLRGLGLDPGATVVRLDELDAEREQAARALWDVPALQQGYRRSRAALARSAARLGSLGVEDAMVESFREGGQVIRQLVLDPLLPEEISPTAERDALVEALRTYDRLGRSVWADFMGRHEVPHLRHPVDVRVAEAAHHFPALGNGGVTLENP